MRQLFILLLFLLTKISFAQNADSLYYKKNNISLEGLGNVIYNGYSVNYERMLIKTNAGFITCRGGFSYAYNMRQMVFPVLFNWVDCPTEEAKGHLEVGIGMALYLHTFPKTHVDTELNPAITGNFMYRFQAPNSRFIFRAGWTPTYFANMHEHYIGMDYTPFDLGLLYLFDIGASIGFAF